MANDELSPFLPKEPQQHGSIISELSQRKGTLTFSEQEVADLYRKLEAKRKALELYRLNDDEHNDLEVYRLKNFTVTSVDHHLYRQIEHSLHFEKSAASEVPIDESKLERRTRLVMIYYERADQRFWSGELVGNYDPDLPKIGMFDFTKLFNAMPNLFGTKKRKTSELLER